MRRIHTTESLVNSRVFYMLTYLHIITFFWLLKITAFHLFLYLLLIMIEGLNSTLVYVLDLLCSHTGNFIF